LHRPVRSIGKNRSDDDAGFEQENPINKKVKERLSQMELSPQTLTFYEISIESWQEIWKLSLFPNAQKKNI
jgi:hypothetical protein